MFTKIFTTRLKTLIRDRETLFWVLLFPMILAFFFNMGLSGLRGASEFDPIPVAVVTDGDVENQGLNTMLDELSKGEDPMFLLERVTLDEAITLLQDGDISAYIKPLETPELVVLRSSFGASVVQSVLNEFTQTTSTITNLIQNDPQNSEAIIASLDDRRSGIENVPITDSDIDPLLNYFYALIGMSCFYGSMLGMREVMEIQANQSDVAARINIAPTHKMKHFLSSSLASLLLHFVQISLLLLFIRFVLQIEFGDKTIFILLTTFLGSLCGIAFGSFLSAVVKASVGVKVAIMISTTMLMSFLSGMMFANMKIIIKQNVPFLAYINPVSLITDSLFSLNYYNDYHIYTQNMIFLAILTIIFLVLTYIFIRRPRYASI